MGSEKQTNSQNGGEEIKDFYVTQRTLDNNILSLIEIKTFNSCCTPVNRITSSQKISDILMIHYSIEYIILFTINTVFMKVSQGKCPIN